MEDINFQLVQGRGFDLTDFPNSEKVIAINGEESQELADVALHRYDLVEASKCLDYWDDSRDLFAKSVFWKMAVIYLVRCFKKNNARTTCLNTKDILPGDNEGQELLLNYINLRDKNIAHDDNAYLQCILGAVINKVTAENKIEKIVCMLAQTEVADDETINNLRLLIAKIMLFVDKRFDQLCHEISQKLETLSHAELVKRAPPNYTKPDTSDMAKNRPKNGA